MQPHAATCLVGHERQRPGEDQEPSEPGDDPGGSEQFNFREWFQQHNFKKGRRGFQKGGRPGDKSDYSYVASLLGITPDYVQRLATGKMPTTRRIRWACRMLDGMPAE